MAKGKAVLTENNQEAVVNDLPTEMKRNKDVERIISTEKENSPIVIRRSKRKTAASTSSIESTEHLIPSKSTAKSSKSKTKKSTSKTKKSRVAATHVAEDVNQTKLNFSTLPVVYENIENKDVPKSDKAEKSMLAASFSSAVTEDSGYAASSGTVEKECLTNSIAVFNSPVIRSYPPTPVHDEGCILTTDSPPLDYWKDLAEQRRVALQNALIENELLHDQLAVLEADCSNLKEALKAAEQMATILKDIL